MSADQPVSGGQRSVPPPDDMPGDMGDQASRLQAVAEQEAIAAALAGQVDGSDSLEDRGPYVEPLEGDDAAGDGDADASDDPLHGGGGDRPSPTREEEAREIMEPTALDEFGVDTES